MASSDPSNLAESGDGPSLRQYQSECLPLSARGSSAALEARDGAFPPSTVGRASSEVAGPGMTSREGGRENYSSALRSFPRNYMDEIKRASVRDVI